MKQSQIIILRDIQLKQKAIDIIRYAPYEPLMQMEVKEYKKKRSLAQNRLYWGPWLTTIAKELGYLETDDLHEEFAKIFLPPEFYKGLDGELHRRRMSTTKLKVGEFTEYLTKIEIWAAGFNIRLPHPEDLYYEAMGRAA